MTASPDIDPPVARPTRPDASMDLLNNLRETALDPSYAAVTRGRGEGRRRPWVVAMGLLMVGCLFGIAVAQTWRTAPAAAQERAGLVSRIVAAEDRIDAARAQALTLDHEVEDLRRSSGALTPAEQSQVDALAPIVGARAVSGPGVRITVDDGADADVTGAEVVDADLRMITNSLWSLRAEAVSVNGHRLTSRTAIRNAGNAITVDYRSLTRPYVIEAIGDARALARDFPTSDGGMWVEGLAQHYGIVWSLERIDDLSLAADAGLTVDRAVRTR